MRNALMILVAVSAVLATRAHAADPAPATHRYHDVNGAKLYVETFGHGRPIVFLHGGLNFFDLNFARQRDYFARFRKVVGIDRTGHGHSPHTAQPFTYHRMSEDMAAVIEQLGLAPWT
jgi:pimeloyl-ACP methyl ester carboxylesterase